MANSDKIEEFLWKEILASRKTDGERNDKLDECLQALLTQDAIKGEKYFYLLGTVHFEYDPSRYIEALKAFGSCLEINPGNEFARYYFANCLIYMKRYEEALLELGRLNGVGFDEMMKMKVEELKIYCKIKMSSLDQLQEDVREFVKKYRPHDYFYDYPVHINGVVRSAGFTLDTF